MTNEITSKKKKRKSSSLIERRDRLGWVFILPFLIGLVFLYASVIWESFTYSFAQYNVIPAIKGGGYSLTFVKFDNFSEILLKVVEGDTEGKTYIEMIFTSFASQIVEIVIIVMFSLFIAVLLNQKMIGRTAFRAIFFIPVVVGAGIIAKIDATASEILDSMASLDGIDMGTANGGEGSSGLVSAMDVNMLLGSLGLPTTFTDMIVGLVESIYSIVNRAGVQMLIFLSGLQSISPAIYESCSIDGASGWESFWKITFPMLSPMILVNAFYTIIDSFTAESNEVMQAIIAISPNGVPSGTQSALAWTYFGIVIVALLLVALLFKNFVFYNRRND
ncbi:MAG: sugar ABC transporter permease [Ruminococcaceae bacterium]|nr:sugar ABC transporter permease [Oscillospiraceae bacterium]